MRLYGTGAGTANAVAQVIMPSKSRIVGVQVAVSWDQVADNATGVVEVSRASAREIAVNGSQQAICEVRSFNNLVTSGASQSAVTVFLPVDIPVDQGQIIYLHSDCSNTTFYATFILHYL